MLLENIIEKYSKKYVLEYEVLKNKKLIKGSYFEKESYEEMKKFFKENSDSYEIIKDYKEDFNGLLYIIEGEGSRETLYTDDLKYASSEFFARSVDSSELKGGYLKTWFKVVNLKTKKEIFNRRVSLKDSEILKYKLIEDIESDMSFIKNNIQKIKEGEELLENLELSLLELSLMFVYSLFENKSIVYKYTTENKTNNKEINSFYITEKLESKRIEKIIKETAKRLNIQPQDILFRTKEYQVKY